MARMKNVFIIVLVCTGIVFLPETTAHGNEFIVDKRTHTRDNYFMQRGRNGENIQRTDPIRPTYERRSYELDSPEELPYLIADYANMKRNDMVLLDNSVKTRTRKRGNVKTFNQAFADPTCSCESSKELIDLGANYYPQYVESRNCIKGSCPKPYQCKEMYYYVTVLKVRSYLDEESHMVLPEELYSRWIANQINVTTACFCA